jgi:hypothetical protein
MQHQALCGADMPDQALEPVALEPSSVLSPGVRLMNESSAQFQFCKTLNTLTHSYKSQLVCIWRFLRSAAVDLNS